MLLSLLIHLPLLMLSFIFNLLTNLLLLKREQMPLSIYFLTKILVLRIQKRSRRRSLMVMSIYHDSLHWLNYSYYYPYTSAMLAKVCHLRQEMHVNAQYSRNLCSFFTHSGENFVVIVSLGEI